MTSTHLAFKDLGLEIGKVYVEFGTDTEWTLLTIMVGGGWVTDDNWILIMESVKTPDTIMKVDIRDFKRIFLGRKK